MTDESRGKRRKQANPRRNRGKKHAALESLKKLVSDAVGDVVAADRRHHVKAAVSNWIFYKEITFKKLLFCSSLLHGACVV